MYKLIYRYFLNDLNRRFPDMGEHNHYMAALKASWFETGFACGLAVAMFTSLIAMMLGLSFR